MRRLALALCAAVLLSIGLPSPASAATIARVWGAGIEPFGVTIDPRDGMVYVANSNHNNWYGPEYMWVIDPTNPNPFDGPTMPRFQLPRAQVMSALDLELDRLFVTLNDGLAIVDPHSHALIGSIPLGGGIGIALDASTHLVYVTTGHGAAIVDGRTGGVLAERQATSTSDAWWQIAHDAERHRVYVANGNFDGAPSLVVLDDADLSMIAAVPLPAPARLALSVDEAHGLVYVGAYSSGGARGGSMYVVDEATLQIVKTLDLGLGIASVFSTTLVAATNTLYVSMIGDLFGRGDEIVVVDVSTFTVLDRIPLDFQPGQSALHPDGRLYVSGINANRLVAIDLHDHAPRIDGVVFDTSSPKTSDTVHAQVAAHDADGDAYTLAYAWSVNGATRTGETGASLDLSKPGNGDRDDLVCLTVSLTGHIGSDRSATCLRVADTAPAASVVLESSAATTNVVLRAAASATDVDADALTYTYTWTVNGVSRRVATSASATDVFDLGASGNGDRGDVVAVTVIAFDGQLGSAGVTANVTVANTAPVASISLSDTAPRKKDTIVATVTSRDDDGQVLSFAYTWRVNGVTKLATNGASATSSLDLRAVGANNGDIVTVDVVASDGVATTATRVTATVTLPGH